MGPFRVIGLVGPVAVRLELSGKLRGVHPVFHISLVRRYTAGGDGVDPPDPVVIDDQVEYEVEALLAHRRRRGNLEFLVRWRGYDSSEDSWLAESDLQHSAELLREYRESHDL